MLLLQSLLWPNTDKQLQIIAKTQITHFQNTINPQIKVQRPCQSSLPLFYVTARVATCDYAPLGHTLHWNNGNSQRTAS